MIRVGRRFLEYALYTFSSCFECRRKVRVRDAGILRTQLLSRDFSVKDGQDRGHRWSYSHSWPLRGRTGL